MDKSAESLVFPFSNVYRRVLQKQDSDASTPSKRLRNKTTLKLDDVAEPSMALVPCSSSTATSSKDAPSLKRQNASVAADLQNQSSFLKDEEQELLERMKQPAVVQRRSKKKKQKMPGNKTKGQVLKKKPAAASVSGTKKQENEADASKASQSPMKENILEVVQKF